ncbi:MAG: lipid-A-disaccharide synthase [Elainellaceae cyanobacterium]
MEVGVQRATTAPKTVRILISTGEVSGDLQGAMLVEALYRQAESLGISLDIVALGGDRMAAAGANVLALTQSIGSVGLVESLPFVLPTLRVQRQAQRYLDKNPPDVVVLLDYLGPNLGMGSYIRRSFPQTPILYYIAPQEWVWSLGSRNTEHLVRTVDQILAIFPEEARYYKAHGAHVEWVGHPLVDRMQGVVSRDEARRRLNIPESQVAIALLPASRRQEIRHLMPVMFAAAQRIQAQVPTAHFWIPVSLEQYRSAIESAVQRYGLRATLVSEDVRTVLSAADLAIAKSGTVNLELAILDVPQLVVYRVHPITAWIATHILKFSIPFMSPPNLVNMEPVVPEFLQEKATPEALTQAALQLLTDETQRQAMREGYERMRQALGTVGVCDRAAQMILKSVI